MGRRKKKADRAHESHNHDKQWSDLVSSLLGLVRVDTARSSLVHALNRLQAAIQNKTEFASEGEWLLQVEGSSARVREACAELQNDDGVVREEVYHLVRSLEKKSQTLPVGESSIDPTRLVLVCRSFMACYRLQAQRTDETVQEILSFLSCLYVNIDYARDNASEGPSDYPAQISSQFSNWINHLENQVHLHCSPWLEALEELQRSGIACTENEEKPARHFESAPETEIRDDDLDRTGNVPLSLNDLVVDAESVMDAVAGFLERHDCTCRGPTVTFLLVVGQHGSGKSHVCNEVWKGLREDESSSLHVLRPTVPTDFMGTSLGETEDTIASMFGLAQTFPKSVLILDDIDRILCQEEDSGRTSVGDESPLQNDAAPHSQTRLVSSFLSHLDSFETVAPFGHQLLIIGTASHLGLTSIGRVDKVFSLGYPNEMERREIIMQSIGIDDYDAEDLLLLDNLVDCTVGRSRSELVQYCRRSIACCWRTGVMANDAVTAAGSKSVGTFDGKEILQTMKTSLQSLTPESLRGGAASDYVDMAVLTARDLMTNESGPGEGQLSLYGNDAARAWEELKALVVMPLCQSNALDQLLYGDGCGGSGKTVCGGALLVGKPGCGKSVLAYDCARVVASILPSVTLLDVSCTSLVHKEVGGSERALHQLFASARAAAPCILLMDGIENIAAVRGHDNTTEGTMDRILSTLLIELDGVESQLTSQDCSGKIAVIGITHNEDWIDPALRRPGRLEKVIRLHNPEHDARYRIVLEEIHSVSALNDCAIASSSSGDARTPPECYERDLARFVADRTDGMSGAEVVALCNDARMEIARECIALQNSGLDERDRRTGLLTRDHFRAAGIRE